MAISNKFGCKSPVAVGAAAAVTLAVAMMSMTMTVVTMTFVSMALLALHIVTVLAVVAWLSGEEDSSAAIAVHAETTLLEALSAGVDVAFSSDYT